MRPVLIGKCPREGRYTFHHLDATPMYVIVERRLTGHGKDHG
jgi:hypothetical protein